jgi:hypothetical protein
MTRKPGDQSSTAATAFDIQRIRVRRDGYDASGAYWGAGPDVFIATSANGSEEITVRARSVSDARDKVAAELARKPGVELAGERTPIGGASPRKSRYEISWRNPVTNQDIRIRITHARDYLSTGNDHIEIESIAPKKAPIPITATGYLSHFIKPLELINVGGAVTFVEAWLAAEAKGKAWTKAITAASQGDLFQWAEASAETARRKRTPKPKRQEPKRSKRRAPTPKHG